MSFCSWGGEKYKNHFAAGKTLIESVAFGLCVVSAMIQYSINPPQNHFPILSPILCGNKMQSQWVEVDLFFNLLAFLKVIPTTSKAMALIIIFSDFS